MDNNLQLPPQLKALFDKILSYEDGLKNQVALEDICQMTDDERDLFEDYVKDILERS